MSAIMEFRNLTKSYGNVRAVNDVSFEIPRRSCFGLLGPNGAGKTTTIEMMEGILAPSSGEVLFDGAPIGHGFKEKVGIQFQTTALPEFITVRETLAMFRSFYPRPRPMDELIEACSLSDIINRDNRKLSGGQRQRLLLALAIMDHGYILEIDTPENLLNRHFEGIVVRVPAATAEDETMEIVTTNLERTVKQLLAEDASLDGLSIHKPNLEDLFIKLTGGSLRT